MSERADIETALLRLTPEAGDDLFAEALGKLDAIGRWHRETKKRLEQAMLDRIEATGRDIVVGEIRYFAGVRKVTKCPDARKALELLLTMAGGDLDLLAELLASDPFKAGACRSVLGERWDEAFTVEHKQELREGKVVKALLSTNERFGR